MGGVGYCLVMSQANVELVRGAYAAWNEGDVAALTTFFTEDGEIRPYLGPVLDASTCRGHEGVAR